MTMTISILDDPDMSLIEHESCACSAQPTCAYCQGTGVQIIRRSIFTLDLTNQNFVTIFCGLGLPFQNCLGKLHPYRVLSAIDRTDPAHCTRPVSTGADNPLQRHLGATHWVNLGLQEDGVRRRLVALRAIADQAMRMEGWIVWS